jgi:tape measure domain-containing protein
VATSVAALQVTVGADISGALSGLNKLNSAVGSAAGFFGRAASTAAGFIGGALGLQALQGVAGGAGDAIFGFNASLEQSQTSFGVMLGSGAKAQSFLESLQSFALSTPFEFPQLISASQRMLAFGFSASQVIPLLTNIGNVASASPSGFAAGLDRISLALGQMQAKGRVQGDELLQLQEAGVNTGQVFEIMSQQTGKSVKSLQAMSTAGKLLPATFIRAFQAFSKARFGGLMDKQSRTFTGAVSNIKDGLRGALATGFLPLFNAVRDGAVQFANFLQTPQWASWVATVRGAVGSFVIAIIARLPAALAFAQQAWARLQAFFVQGAAWFQSTLLPVLAQIGADLRANVAPIIAFVVAFQGVLAVTGIVLAVAGALAFLLSPIGLLATAAGLLASAWVGNWGNIQGIVLGFWAVAQPILTDLWNWLAVNVPAALSTLAGFWMSTLLPAITEVWTWLSTNLPAALATLSAFWTGTLLPAITEVWAFVSTNLLPLFAAVGGLLVASFLFAGRAIGGALGILAEFGAVLASVILPPLQALWGWLSSTLLPVFTAIGAGLAAIGQGTPAWLQGLTTSLNVAGGQIAAAPIGGLPGPAALAGGAGAGTVDNSVTVTLTGNTIASQVDVDDMAQQLAAAVADGQRSAANAAPNTLVGAT